ncbi:hypothetical protein LPB90_06725 [Chryseobacterium sp. LC2016-29]|nr:hypothetical protein [Chryseobacterium sp. LC2016-29]MCD0478144.1 hypothetical protein [Chryseobacterium sp. LC2016-29]
MIDNFTGTIEYTSADGDYMGTIHTKNSIATTSTSGIDLQGKSSNCTYELNLIEVKCAWNAHTPAQYNECPLSADEKPYYILDISYKCTKPEVAQFPNMGLYDGGGSNGGGNSDDVPVNTSMEDAFNLFLGYNDFPELTSEQYSYIQNHQYIGSFLLGHLGVYFSDNNRLLMLWAIDYLRENNTFNLGDYKAVQKIEPFINFAQQFFADSPSTTWEQFYNQYLLPHINIDNSLVNSKTLCVLNKISGDININDQVINLPLDLTKDNFVQKMFRNFNGVSTPNINFYISNTLSNNDWGQTLGSDANNYKIYINKSVEIGSSLMKIITITHELVHAYMIHTLHQAGVINFDSEGNPLTNVNCYQNINYNGFQNLNNLTVGERFIVLFCLMNQNGTQSLDWIHDIFNQPLIDASIYRANIENYLLNSYDWENENITFKNEALNTFGSNWKKELAKAISWIGLEATSEYESYFNSYVSSPNKYFYIKEIRNKILNSNNGCN